MTAASVPTAAPAAARKTALWSQVKAGAHRRAGRVEWIILVLVMLAPQLVILLLVAD